MLVDGKLMRKSAKEGILQKCITREEGAKLLLEIHFGSYGNHVASRNLVSKVCCTQLKLQLLLKVKLHI